MINLILSRGLEQEEIFAKLGIFFICIARIMPSILKIYNITYTINFYGSSASLIKDKIVDNEIYLNEINIGISHSMYNYKTKILDNVRKSLIKDFD